MSSHSSIKILFFGAVLLPLSLLASSGLAAQAGPTSIELTPLFATDAGHAGSEFLLAVTVQLDEGYHVNSVAPLDPFLIPTELVFDTIDGVTVQALAFPEAEMFQQADLELAVYGTRFTIGASVLLAEDLAPGEYALPAMLRYQSCDDTTCYSPTQEPIEFIFSVVAADRQLMATNEAIFAEFVFDSEPVVVDEDSFWFGREDAATSDIDVDGVSLDDFEIMGTTGGFLGVEDFREFIAAAESGEGNRGFFEGRGPIAVLLITLLGGLALNLTPCVLPMVPINLAIIGAGSASSSKGRGFALGSAYGLAMALVYGILGLIVILTAGTFGTINASPWFNLGIAVLFVVLSLAMFDKLVIDFSRLQSKLKFGNAEKGSFVLAFGMGAVAALLAGACVAPVVIQVVVFSSNLYATGTTEALALPFILGLGMALPWPIAGAGISSLPKPGPWMNKVKHVFGVFILGTAVYYGYLSFGLFSQYWVDPDEVAGSVEALLEEGWHASLDSGLAEALADDKLVLIDMWATWCKNCLVMDETTLRDEGVQADLEDYVKIKYQAENLNVSPVREVAKRLGVIGLPAYAILRPLR